MTNRLLRIAIPAAALALVGSQAATADSTTTDTGARADAAASTPAVTAAGSKARTIRRVTARLGNVRLIRFTQSGSSSFDQTLHLCRNKSFIYDTVSSSEFGEPDVRRVEGRWRVVSASISGRVWKARVRGTPSDGSPALTVTIRTDGQRTTVNGLPVIAERSDLC